MIKLSCPACGLGLFNSLRYEVGDNCPRCVARRGERVPLAPQGVSLGVGRRFEGARVTGNSVGNAPAEA